MDAAKKKSKSQYDVKYAKDNIKRVPLDMQKTEYEALKEAATARGEKVNEYIKKAIRERMEREQNNAGGNYDNLTPADSPQE